MIRRALIWAIVIVVVITSAMVGYLLMTGPRMYYLPNIRPHQALMPDLPDGTAPVQPLFFPSPTTQEARGLKNPLSATPDTIGRGQVYYDYYCVFCHDQNGSGAAEVGRSYTPAPADLREMRLRQFSDGEYLQRSLTGEGHSPVLEQVIPPEHRWYVVLYARRFAEESKPPQGQ